MQPHKHTYNILEQNSSNIHLLHTLFPLLISCSTLMSFPPVLHITSPIFVAVYCIFSLLYLQSIVSSVYCIFSLLYLQSIVSSVYCIFSPSPFFPLSTSKLFAFSRPFIHFILVPFTCFRFLSYSFHSPFISSSSLSSCSNVSGPQTMPSVRQCKLLTS
jgi:hypothetical protein